MHRSFYWVELWADGIGSGEIEVYPNLLYNVVYKKNLQEEKE
jgi:hypothetical protein